MRVALGAVIGLLALLAGCTNGGSPAAGAGGSADGVTGPPSAPAATTDPALADLVDPVIADAAARLAVDPGTIRVVSVDAATWPDGSLGCPKPGELYTQALVDGHRIVVASGDTSLDYRVTGPGAFRVCEDPPSPEP